MSPLSFGSWLTSIVLLSYVVLPLRTDAFRYLSSFLKNPQLPFSVGYPNCSPPQGRSFLLPQKTTLPRRVWAVRPPISMAPKVLVPIAEGSEEIEAVCIIDTLRRAGAEVTVASVESSEIVCMSRGVNIKADKLISDVAEESFDCIAIPGGMPGAERCRDSAVLTKMLKNHHSQRKLIAAICASPYVVLHTHGLLQGEKAVAYPCFMEKFPAEMCGEGRVCVSNTIVTSVGPSSTFEFSMKLIEMLCGAEKAKKVASDLLMAN